MQQEIRNEHRNEENHWLIHLSKETACFLCGFLSLFFQFCTCNRSLFELLVWVDTVVQFTCVTGNQHSFFKNHPTVMDKEQNQRQQHFEEKPRNTHSVCNLMAYVQMLLPSILLCSWGRLMWMLMQNLISLQHALSAPNPNCVEYREYIFTCTSFCPLLLWTVCFTRFVELAVKHVQF